MLQFFLEGGTIVSARPSGTEPKIKFYINTRTDVNGSTDEALEEAKKEASVLCDKITSDINELLDAAGK